MWDKEDPLKFLGVFFIPCYIFLFGGIYIWLSICFFVVVGCYSATYEQVRVKSIPLPILHASTHCGANLSCSLGWAGKHERTVWFTDRLTMPQIGRSMGLAKIDIQNLLGGCFWLQCINKMKKYFLTCRNPTSRCLVWRYMQISA